MIHFDPCLKNRDMIQTLRYVMYYSSKYKALPFMESQTLTTT